MALLASRRLRVLMKVDSFSIEYPSIRATLNVFPSSNNAELYVVSDAESYGESKYQLKEGRSYEYEFESWDGNNETFQFNEENEIIKYSRSKHQDRGILRTGIYVGTLTLYIKSNTTNDIVGKVELEVQSEKASYREDYYKMLEDITNYYTELVMLQGSPTTKSFMVDENLSSQTLYQKFSFVRSIVESENFIESIHKIQSNPIRKWSEALREVDITNVKRLSRKGLRQIVSKNNRIRVFENGAFNNPYPFDTLPRTISVPYKRDSIDNIENQFVKYALQSFFSFCSYIQTLRNASHRLVKEAAMTCNKLSGMLSTSFFKEVSLPQHLNLNSPALQRKEGYREVLQVWLIFDLAAKLCWKGGDDVYKIGMRNVAMLYEYWIFFKLLELVSSVFNIPKTEKTKLVDFSENNINLNLKEGDWTVINGIYDAGSRKINIRLNYNRTFTGSHTISSAGSWTTSMRPDYTLTFWPGEGVKEEEAEKENLIVHIHLDAKYRLNKILLDDDTSDTNKISDELLKEKKEQALGVYKRADLLKMHAYKDAIRRTSGAYILYPGNVNHNKVGFHEIIPGLGAFCISPGNVETEIGALKNFILKVVDHLLNRTSQREKLSYYDYSIHKDPPEQCDCVKESLPESYGSNRDFLPDQTNVIIGYYKTQKHLDWIKENHMYNARAGERKGALAITKELLTARYLLLHNGKDAALYKIKVGGPKVYGYNDMKTKNYPFDLQDKNTEKIYLIFHLNQKGIEKEMRQYRWDASDVIKLKPHKVGKTEVVKLTELMKIAKLK